MNLNDFNVNSEISQELPLPRRRSLVVQTADYIRSAIINGIYRDYLPGENDLSKKLRISRLTLRSALKILEFEGIITAGRGKRRKIKLPAGKEESLSQKKVTLLSPLPIHQLPWFVISWIDALRECLYAENYSLEIEHNLSCYKSNPEKSLFELVKHSGSVMWILYRSTVSMQKWFNENHVPCVITGSRHGGVNLPAVDINYKALAHHAVGLLLARGYKDVFLLIEDSGLAGDIETEEGFLSTVNQFSQYQAKARVLHHNGTSEGLCNQLSKILPSDRPTGLLVANARSALTVLCWLLQKGIQLPSKVGLISRDDDTFLEHTLPIMARYKVTPEAYAQKLAHIVVRQLRGELISASDCKILPHLIKGSTL